MNHHAIAPQVLLVVGESSHMRLFPKAKLGVIGKGTNHVDSSSSLPPTASTGTMSSSDSDFEDLFRDRDEKSRAAGLAVMKQMHRFDSSSSLQDNGFLPFVELTWSELNVDDLLGSGAFSSVYRVRILPQTKEASHNGMCQHCDVAPTFRDSMCHRKFVVKFLDEKIWQKDIKYISQAAADLAQEAKLLSRLNHENIIQLHGTSAGCPSASFVMDQRGFFLVLGLLSETLSRRLQRWRSSGHRRVMHRLQIAATGIVKGMEYLHSNNIVFRDLKPNNVGWCETTGDIKIFDFGLAVELPKGAKLKSTVGTPRYMGHEILSGQGYDFSCDVYSFGILLWQVCSLQRGPFPGMSRNEIWALVASGQRPSLKHVCCQKRVKKLIKDCWNHTPESRPTFKTILQRLEKVLR